jgi:hypothetical protein
VPARRLSTVALALITVLVDVPSIVELFRAGAVLSALIVVAAAFAVGCLLVLFPVAWLFRRRSSRAR